MDAPRAHADFPITSTSKTTCRCYGYPSYLLFLFPLEFKASCKLLSTLSTIILFQTIHKSFVNFSV